MNKEKIFGILFLFLALAISVSARDIYVDLTNVACNNTGAGNSSQPFCSFTTGLANLTNGDILYIGNGEYIATSGFSLSSKVFTSTTKIKNIPGTSPIIISAVSDWNSGTMWKNQSLGIWNSTYSSSATLWGVTRNDTNATMFIYSAYADMANTSKPEGCYWDGTPDILYCRFANTSFNPNSIKWVVSKAAILTLTDVDNLEIDNLTFKGGVKQIYLPTATPSINISIINSRFLGVSAGGSIDSRGTTTLNVTNNYFEQKRTTAWDWTTTKSSNMENTAIYLTNGVGVHTIKNNVITTYFNAIYFTASASTQFLDSEVAYNTITNVFDDGIELEGYGNGNYVHHNNVSDTFTPVSLIPYNSTAKTTKVEYNILQANKNNWYNYPSTYYYGECFKMASGSGTARFVNISNNDCVGKGIYATTGQTHIWYNVTIRDNIFYQNQSDRIVDKTGLAVDGVLYKNNLFYRTDNNHYFRYFNNDTNSAEYSLAEALASSDNPGTWTGNIDSNPIFQPGTFTPASNSQVCNGSTTGGLIGALACQPPNITICNDLYTTRNLVFTCNGQLCDMSLYSTCSVQNKRSN